MKLKKVRSIARTAVKGRLLPYVGGRFYHVREAHGRLRGLFEPAEHEDEGVYSATLFPELDVEACVRAIRRDSVALGLMLPQDCVEEIRAFAECRPCIRPHLINRATPLGVKATERFYKKDVTAGRLPNGELAPMAMIVGADESPAVARIVNDLILLKVARRFLRYRPAKRRVKLFWSFPGDVDHQGRLDLHQTVDYHFDVEGFSFLYVNFYLTDTDRSSGAHALVKGSHRGKSLAMLKSAAAPAETVLRRYGHDNVLLIERPRGFGFIEDAACYHKAIAPITQERLLLQIRYS